MQDKENYDDWFFMFDFGFGKLYLVKPIVDIS